MATALSETNLMQITGLEFLFLEVNNLEESVAFYRDSLGFEVSKHSPGVRTAAGYDTGRQSKDFAGPTSGDDVEAGTRC